MTETAIKLHALKCVGNFAGDADIERWVDRMEMALRIDGIPAEQHADVLALHLEGPAYDTWKGLSEMQKQSSTAIKAKLRAVFGLQRMDAWNQVASLGPVVPGDTIDVMFEEVKKLVGIAAKGEDLIGCIAACLLTARLLPPVRDQVLLQCGKDMKAASVVKQLLSASRPGGLAAAANLPNKTTSKKAPDRLNRQNDRGQIKCYWCRRPGHFARRCPTDLSELPAVSGNGQSGQPLP